MTIPCVPGGEDEAVGRVAHVLHEVAEEERLALLLQAEHRVELRLRLARQHRLQEGDVGGRHLHVDHEVRAREAEDAADVLGLEQQRVDVDRAVARCAAAARRRGSSSVPFMARPTAYAALFAEEERRQDLDLEVVVQRARAREVLAHRPDDAPHVAVEVLERAGEAEARQRLADGRAQAALHRVVAAVGRLLAVEVLGRDGRRAGRCTRSGSSAGRARGRRPSCRRSRRTRAGGARAAGRCTRA